MLMKPTRRNFSIGVLGVALLVGLALSGGPAGAAPAGLSGQTKMPLADTSRGCDGVETAPPTGTFGSATMNQTKANKNQPSNLSAGLTVQGAAKGATYNIRLIQVDNDGNVLGDSCDTIVGTVALDEFGNGTTSVSARVLPDATQWWVDLNNQSSFIDFVDTGLVPVG
jgi:hypothetical protein